MILITLYQDESECRYEKIIPERNQLNICKSLLGVHSLATNNLCYILPKTQLYIKHTYIALIFTKGLQNNLKIVLDYVNFNHVWQNPRANKCNF